MATTGYFLNQFFTTSLNVGGGIDDTQTTGIVIQAVSGLDITKPGIACISYSDPINTSTAEWVTYTSINGSNELQGVTRGTEGFGAKTHSNGATVAFPISESHINNLATALSIGGVATNLVETTKDEDDMASNSATALATQQSIKAYVDTYGQFSSVARQAIINGNFDVWQRGTTATNQASGDFLADRWKSYKAAGSGGALPTNVVESKQLLTSGDIPGSFYYFRVAPDGAGTTAADQLWQRYQPIEHGTRLLCGDGKTVTLSFYARASVASKKLGVYFEQNYGTTGSPSSTEQITGDAFTLTSSWVKYTLTVTTNTLASKTFGTDNNDYLNVVFAYAWGTNYDQRVGESTAETFGGSGTIDIAQVQLCAGSVALPFQPKSYEDEETACERYCQAFVADQTNGTIGAIGIAFNTAGAQLVLPLRRRMRTVPTLTATASDWKIGDSSSSTDVTAMVLASAINSSSSVVLEVSASSVTQFRPYILIGDGTANRTLILNADY